jgi:uncharacterized protein (DUF3820 family)
MKVDDNYIVPFGVFKGKPIGEVPAYYLLWLLEKGNPMGKLRLYIEQNKALLEKELSMPSSYQRSTLDRDN